MGAIPTLRLDEFLRMEETRPASEYVGGAVVQKPDSSLARSFILMYLGALLLQFLAQTRLGRAGISWGCIFGPPGAERFVVPDLAYVEHGRLTGEPYHRRAPDLVAEFLASEYTPTAFRERVRFYPRHGVRLVWVVDSEQRTITVHAPDTVPLILTRGDTLDGGAVLPGFSASVDEIFAQMEIDA